MSIPFYSPIDLKKNELQNPRLQNLGTPPSSPVTGQFYYDTVNNAFVFWNGTAWVTSGATDHGALTGLNDDDHAQYLHITTARTVTARHTFNPSAANSPFILGANAVGQIVTGLNADQLDGLDSTAFSLTGHTHVAANITNFDTAVRTSRLDQMAAPTASVSLNSQKITNLLDPTLAQDAATKFYVDSIATGLDIKASVRAASTAAINLSAPGAAIDGVTMAAGNRFLAKNQSVGSENGIYVWNGAASVATRATDADSNAEVTPGMFMFVEEGTVNADTGWVLANDGAITLGSTALAFTQFSSAGSITGASVGVGGIAVFKDKTGITLNFRSINVGSNKLSVTLDGANNEIDLDVLPANIDKNTLGGAVLTVANGGTGAGTAAAARTSLGAITKYAATIGDGSLTTIPVTHSLGTSDITYSVRQVASPFAFIEVEGRATDNNTLTLYFGPTAPAVGEFRVIVTG